MIMTLSLRDCVCIWHHKQQIRCVQEVLFKMLILLCFFFGFFYSWGSNEDAHAHEQPSPDDGLHPWWGLQVIQDTHDCRLTLAGNKLTWDLNYSPGCNFHCICIVCLLPPETAGHCGQRGETGEGSHPGTSHSVSCASSRFGDVASSLSSALLVSRTRSCRSSTRPSWPTCRAWSNTWTRPSGR